MRAMLMHHPRIHAATHHIRHIVELVEDMRPFVHIFFANIAPPVAVMVIAAGIVGFIRSTH